MIDREPAKLHLPRTAAILRRLDNRTRVTRGDKRNLGQTYWEETKDRNPTQRDACVRMALNPAGMRFLRRMVRLYEDGEL